MKHKSLHIDIETYSPVDLAKSGVYPYASHPDAQILLFAYAFDDEPVAVIDLISGEALPPHVLLAMLDPDITKKAHNAAFERVCIREMLGIDVPAAQWECTMVTSAANGLPFSLDQVGQVLRIENAKMQEGRALIRYFCMPCKPSRTNGGRTRNLPAHEPEKWALFKEYCACDVEAEREIDDLLKLRLSHYERNLYALDQQINDRGMLVDLPFAHNAIAIDSEARQALIDEAAEITGLANPNSVPALRAWLEGIHDEEIPTLRKSDLPGLLDTLTDEGARRVVEIRQRLGKTSVSKYAAMVQGAGSDSRVRGLFQFYGAGRTGRWAGRLVQVQNLPQNHLATLDTARAVVAEGDGETLEMLYDSVQDTLSQLIRTAFVAPRDYTLAVADYSAIEARVLAWLAGEQWRLEVFQTHGKIYEASASAMFGVPIWEITKGSPLRQKGKVAELALGYQGGPAALVAMGALSMGLTEEELPAIVSAWRSANESITYFWAELQNAAIRAIDRGTTVKLRRGLAFCMDAEGLTVQLPSGRKLMYRDAHIGTNRYGSRSIAYWGYEQTGKKWAKMETYGGKLAENITQAVARDCLAEAMVRLSEEGFSIVGHVHDEIIAEVPAQRAEEELARACALMGEGLKWAKGLPLRADGYLTPYYRKD